MRSFEDVSTTIRETTLVVSASLTFIFLLWAAVVIRSVIQRGNLLNPLFLSGLVLFSIFGFFMLEIAGRFGFIGGGLKFGAAGIVLLVLLGAWVGGDTGVAFFSGSISGITLFYVKSIYVVYFIYKTETRKTEPVLSVSEAEPLDGLQHYKITGIGSNFELLNYMIEALCDGAQVMYYARYREENDGPWGRFIEDTMLFYGNYLSPLHTVKSRRSFQLIRQIALEASYLDTMERALFNYWLRAYLTGDYLSVVVFGQAQVKVNNNEPIKAGDALSLGNGAARKIKTTVVNGLTIAENTGILGKALENSNGKGMVTVFVNCK